MSFLHLFFKKFSAVLFVDPTVSALSLSNRDSDLDPECVTRIHISYNAFSFFFGLGANSRYIWWIIVPIELMLVLWFDRVVVLVLGVGFGQIRHI